MRRVAIVTGAASGIGRATAERFASAAYGVVAVDIDAERLLWAESEKEVETLIGDASVEETNTEAVALAGSRFGRLDVVVLNAGGPTPGNLETLSEADFERALTLNMRSCWLGIRAAAPALRRADSPAIVVTASVSGLGGDPGLFAYNAAKAGVINLVRAAALELGRDAIRVNAVCPGPIRTPMTESITVDQPELAKRMAERIPLGRWGEPGEVAAVIEFLASPDASFVSGAIVPVDGGIRASSGQF